MKIIIGADHSGFHLKEELKKHLIDNGYEVNDMGADKLDAEDDYPDYVVPTAQNVAQNPGSFGIVIGRSGNGEAILANKVKGVRAALCLNEIMAQLAREHNDANILSLGADFVDQKVAKQIVDAFLKTPFSNEERHKRRVGKVKYYETAQNH